MKRLLFRLLAGMVLLLPGVSYAHIPHVCPEGIVDIPGFIRPEHVEQSELLNGRWENSQFFQLGAALADARFNKCDGQGRPETTGGLPSGSGDSARAPGQPAMHRLSGPEANSCAGCHAQPRAGGSGDFVANTFNGAELLDPVTDSVSPEVSNERNTTGMFGSGHIELLAIEMTKDLHQQRDEYIASATYQDGWRTLRTKSVPFEVEFAGHEVVAARGVDTDLIVKPFGAGGTKVSLREFNVGASNRHHGLQAEEAFDLFLGDPDYDGDGITRELTIGDMTVMTLWAAMLDQPIHELPRTQEEIEVVKLGEQRFSDVGCASCHTPVMKLNSHNFCEPNPYNPPGIWNDQSQKFCVTLDITPHSSNKADWQGGNVPMPVRTYTDLKRHHMCDDAGRPGAIRVLCNELHAEGRPDQDGIPGQEFFLTADLWQVAESAPWGHDGRYNSLSSIILAHAGEARRSRDAFATLPGSEQLAMIQFLRTLKLRNQRVRTNDG